MGTDLVLKKIEDQRTMKEVRSNKTLLTRQNYLEHSFINGDRKEQLICHVSALGPALNRLNMVDQSLKKESLTLGRRGQELLDDLVDIKATLKNGRLSIKGYFEAHFGKRSNRIYEAIAMTKAINFGASSDLSMTQLQVLGSALESKDVNRKMLARRCIETGQLPDNGGSLIESNMKVFLAAFRTPENNSTGHSLKRLLALTKETKSLLLTILKTNSSEDPIFKSEEAFFLKNELCLVSQIIEEFENNVSKKTTLH